MVDQDVDHLQPVFHAACLNRLAEHGFSSVVMPTLVEVKRTAVDIVRYARLTSQSGKPLVLVTFYLGRRGTPVTSRIGDRPARKRFGDLDDVFLRVSAVHSKCVKLHQFTGIVLVDSAFRPVLGCLSSGLHLFQACVKLRIVETELLLHPVAGTGR